MKKVDRGVLETLIERSNIFTYQKKHYFLFSKSGFTKGCMEKAKELENVQLKNSKLFLILSELVIDRNHVAVIIKVIEELLAINQTIQIEHKNRIERSL